MISDQKFSKVEFHRTSEREGKDKLAELYLTVDIDREVCVVYNLIMMYSLFSTYCVAVHQRVMSRYFSASSKQTLSLKANNK